MRCIALSLLLAIFPLCAQQGEPIRTTTQEVLLDLVVRDKAQRAVTDLGAQDVEVLENGVAQKVSSFRYYDGRRREGTPEGPTPAAANAAALDPMRQINLVTLVFESMNNVARLRALQFSRDFLNNELRSNTFAAVFTLNHRLALVQPYTNRADLLGAAVEKVSQGQYLKIADQSAQIVSLMQQQESYRPLYPGSAEDRGPAIGANSGGRADAAFAEIKQRVAALTMRMLLHQQGALSIEALRTVIREQSTLPGRKTVIYFCQGLVIPPDLPDLLRTVISEANRANITFYGVDATGLTAESSSLLGPLTAAEAMARYADHGGNAAQYHNNLQQNLSELAENTGGFAMVNSNDLRTPLRHVMEDVNAHYELSYVPKWTNYDGSFRNIEVRLKRPGLRAHYRKGYYALPVLQGRALAPFEMAALSALNTSPAPQTFDVRVSALALRLSPEGVDHRIVFEIPAESLKFEGNPKAKAFRVHVSVLGLLKNADGAVVEKVSSDLPFSAALDKQEAFRKGTVTIALPATLSPGRYLLEAAVIDRNSLSASVRRLHVTVPGVQPLWLSDVVIARRIDPPRPDRDALDPLQASFGVITPAVRTTVSRADLGSIPVYALLQAQTDQIPDVVLQVMQDGKLQMSLKPEIGKPDQMGAFPISAALDSRQWTEGAHEITLIAKQGTRIVSRVASVIVE